MRVRGEDVYEASSSHERHRSLHCVLSLVCTALIWDNLLKIVVALICGL